MTGEQASVSDAVLSYYTGNQQLTLTVNSTKNPGREFIKGRPSPMSTTTSFDCCFHE